MSICLGMSASSHWNRGAKLGTVLVDGLSLQEEEREMSRLCRVLGFVLALSLALSFWGCDDETILDPEDLNPPLNDGAGKR